MYQVNHILVSKIFRYSRKQIIKSKMHDNEAKSASDLLKMTLKKRREHLKTILDVFLW